VPLTWVQKVRKQHPVLLISMYSFSCGSDLRVPRKCLVRQTSPAWQAKSKRFCPLWRFHNPSATVGRLFGPRNLSPADALGLIIMYSFSRIADQVLHSHSHIDTRTHSSVKDEKIYPAIQASENRKLAHMNHLRALGKEDWPHSGGTACGMTNVP